jgi:hypothetical protein
MRNTKILTAVALAAAVLYVRPATAQSSFGRSVQAAPGEKHLANIRQLTNGGENAEA